jgi:cbb3-type cytochrome oxidase subunit 3
MFQILKNEGLPGLAIYLKDRLGVRARLLIIAFLIILPALLALFFIKTYAVNVSAWDDLRFVPLFDKVYTGHLSFGDLFAQHNEHRIFFPRLAMLGLGVLTHHNTNIECYFSWFLLCLIGCVLFLVYIREFGTKETALVAFIPISWLIFSVRQSGNLLSGFQMQFYMMILFLILAFYLLATSSSLRWRFALSVACGVISTFSLANGLLVWPIGLMLILWMRQSQPKELRRLYLKMGAIWCLIGIAVFISYLASYHDLSGHIKFEYLMQHPLSVILYFVAALGGFINVSRYTAYAIGLVLFSLFAYAGVSIVYRSKARLSTAFSLSLMLFVLGSVVLLTWGRSFFGVEEAMTSRYTSVTILGIVGLYLAIISSKTKFVDLRRLLLVFLIILIIAGCAHAYVGGITDGRWWRNWSNWQAYELSTYRVQSDDTLKNLIWPPSVQQVREAAEVLEKYRLNVFSTPSLKTENLTLAEGSTQFHIDSVNDSPLSQQNPGIINVSLQNETLTISGWAVDQEAKNTAGGVFVSIDGQIDIPAMYGGDRPDIAASLGENRYRFSGFVAFFATSVVGEGQHVLSLKIVTSDKKAYYEPDQEILIEVR